MREPNRRILSTNRRRATAGMAGLLVTAAVLMMVASSAWASGTRIRSMGGRFVLPSAGTNFNISTAPEMAEAWLAYDDEINIFMLPATLTKYGNRAMFDELSIAAENGDPTVLGEYPRARFGFHLNLTEYTVLALYGSNADVGVAAITPNTNFGGPSAGGYTTADAAANGEGVDLSADLKLSMLIAHDLGGVRLGLAFNVWGDSFSIEAPDDQAAQVDALVIDFDLGLGLDFTGDNSLDIGLGLRFADFTSTGTFAVGGVPQEVNFFEPETNFGIELNARGVINFFQGMQLIPFAQFIFEREGITDVFPADQQNRRFADTDHFGIELGVNLKIEPFENVFIYPTLGMRFDLIMTETESGDLVDDRRFAVPYYGFGLDARIWDWFAWRMGARQYMVFDQDASTIVVNETTTAETDQRDHDVLTTFDMGFALFFGETDNFILEFHMNPDILLNGPNLVSGVVTDNFMFDAAVKYLW